MSFAEIFVLSIVSILMLMFLAGAFYAVYISIKTEKEIDEKYPHGR